MIKVIFSDRPCPQGGIDDRASCGYVVVNTPAEPDREQVAERDLQQSGGIGANGICQCCKAKGTIEWIQRS